LNSDYPDLLANIFLGRQTASQLEAFFLAMMLYPAVQATAQRELDRVVGQDRLPDINDRAQLPYIDALCLFRRTLSPSRISGTLVDPHIPQFR
jgi:hypothetical protein